MRHSLAVPGWGHVTRRASVVSVVMEGWTAILMAGGKGTRMRSSKPKALHCVAGVPMVRYAVSAAAEAAIALAVIVVSPTNRDAIAEELGDEVGYAEQPGPVRHGKRAGRCS